MPSFPWGMVINSVWVCLECLARYINFSLVWTITIEWRGGIKLLERLKSWNCLVKFEASLLIRYNSVWSLSAGSQWRTNHLQPTIIWYEEIQSGWWDLRIITEERIIHSSLNLLVFFIKITQVYHLWRMGRAPYYFQTINMVNIIDRLLLRS